MHNSTNCLHHGNWIVTLEDVASHINSTGTLFTCVICHLQCVTLWALLTTGDHDRHWAAAGDGIKILIRVVALHQVAAEFRHDRSLA